MGQVFSLIIEGGVALLLSVCIWFVFVLNKKLKTLREDEKKLQDTVSALLETTVRAEQAIHGLKQTSVSCEHQLRELFGQAENVRDQLDERIAESGHIVDRLHAIVMAGNKDTGEQADLSHQSPSFSRVSSPKRKIGLRNRQAAA